MIDYSISDQTIKTIDKKSSILKFKNYLIFKDFLHFFFEFFEFKDQVFLSAR